MSSNGDRGGPALLIVDMISDYRFYGAATVAEAAAEAVPRIRAARDCADAAGIPVVYTNDIIDDWRSDPRRAVGRAMASADAEQLVRPLLPRTEDAFLHKGRHSAFNGTPLEHYLLMETIDEVVLTGQITEQCILYTALDAHMRHYDITVIDDAVVPMDEALGDAALRMMAENMGARVVPLARWMAIAHA